MTPKLQMSHFEVKDPLNISGDMYEGVPPTRELRLLRPAPKAPKEPLALEGKVGASTSWGCNGCAALKTSAMPKSASITWAGSLNSSWAVNLGLATSMALSHFMSL
mmetsp:Transcript_53686/g.103755  ORF Transcript_53686/g.103755 Transcript_53686/m.103755 type:complete len:106 (+) Transcript_53686:1000-1317(+)